MFAVQVRDGASFLKRWFLVPVLVADGIIAYEMCHQAGEHPDCLISYLGVLRIKAKKKAVLKNHR